MALILIEMACSKTHEKDNAAPVVLKPASQPVLTHKAEIITQLPTADSVIALTFDACETKTPAYFDTALLMLILQKQLPATLFISGRFAERNRHILEKLAWIPFIEIENHSYAHALHMEKMDSLAFIADVTRNEDLLQSITGRKPRFFRFPAGNCDTTAIRYVSLLGYQTVHWSYASGDADATLSAKRLKKWISEKTNPGNILIFHINRRGYHTAEILPELIDTFRTKRMKWALLKDYLR